MKKNMIKVLLGILCIVVGFGVGIGYRYFTDKSNPSYLSSNEDINVSDDTNNDAHNDENVEDNDAENNQEELKNEEKNDKEDKDASKDNSSDNTSIKSDTQTSKLTLESKFTLVKTSMKEEPTFNTPWKSNSKKINACIEGKGDDAIDEGIGFVVLKDNNSLSKISLEGSNGKYSPIYVEWFDDSSILMTVGNSQGTERTGYTLYKVSLNDLKPMIVYKATSSEIISEATKIDSNKINIKIFDNSNGKSEAKEKDIIIN